MIITREYLEKFNPVVEDEIWKDYPDDDRVQVSTWGNVRTKDYNVEYYNSKGTFVSRLQKSRTIEINEDRGGYLTCGCTLVSTSYVHRLVGLTFLSCPEKLEEYDVDHIDFNRRNPYVSNLQWMIHKDNCHRSHERVCKVNKELNGIHVVELRSGKKYDSIVDLANTFKDGTLNKRVSTIRNGMEKYFGYVPQYDIMVFKENDVPDIDVEDIEIKDLRLAAECVYSNRPAIYCKTLDRWFPSIPETARQLNFSIQYFREIFEKFSGYYAKYNMYFEKVSWNEVPDFEILRMKPYIIYGFTSRKGNGKGNN